MNKTIVVIKGEAKCDYPNLVELHGISCEEDFTEYFDSDFTFKDKIDSGYMSFSYENGKLFTLTVYNCNCKLTEEELLILEEYTQGQWSDGIGEGFEQRPAAYVDDYLNSDGEITTEVYISPWFFGQKINTIQKELT